MSEPFSTIHTVQFYETDQMGVVHHSNYLRFFEEARVAWAHSRGLIDYQNSSTAARFAVLETQVCHRAPSFFGDRLQIQIEAKREGAKVRFQYRALCNSKVIALGQTLHAALTPELKPTKPAPEMLAILRSEKWTEIWL